MSGTDSFTAVLSCNRVYSAYFHSLRSLSRATLGFLSFSNVCTIDYKSRIYFVVIYDQIATQFIEFVPSATSSTVDKGLLRGRRIHSLGVIGTLGTTL